MAVRSAAEFVYSGLGEGEVLQKWRNIGNFGGAGSDLGPLGGPYENCLTLSANSGMGV